MMGEHSAERDTCASCGETGVQPDECPASGRPCGHHCNHVWEQDECCWCRSEFVGEDVVSPAERDLITRVTSPGADR